MRRNELKALVGRALAAEVRRVFRELVRDGNLLPVRDPQQEVAAHEEELSLLLSIHKRAPGKFDWVALSASLVPLRPGDVPRTAMRAVQNGIMAKAGYENFAAAANIEEGRRLDARQSETEIAAYDEARRQWEAKRTLANRVLAKDVWAYREALADWEPFDEAAALQVRASYSVHSPLVVECIITVPGTGIVPAEIKVLSKRGKVSARRMPKRRFNEIYQDYVCGCALRAAREVFAYLPFEVAMITAVVEDVDSIGAKGAFPILSVILPRSQMKEVNWESADASDTVDLFEHRGDVKASRKTGEFEPIEPLSVDDIEESAHSEEQLGDLLRRARQLRQKVNEELQDLVRV